MKSARDEGRARAALSALGDGAPAGLLGLTRAEERARLAALARRRSEEVPERIDGPGWEVRTGDLREVLARGEKGPCDHPWQQTVGPFSRLVEMAARPGELVLDPFLGSGTTALACLATGRRFLGCDVDPGAVSLALERLQAASQDSA